MADCKECLEQARLLGMSAEREVALRAEIDRYAIRIVPKLEAQIERLRAALCWIEDHEPQLVSAAIDKFNLHAVEQSQWCRSCGTVTKDRECDCTRYGNPGNQALETQ